MSKETINGETPVSIIEPTSNAPSTGKKGAGNGQGQKKRKSKTLEELAAEEEAKRNRLPNMNAEEIHWVLAKRLERQSEFDGSTTKNTWDGNYGYGRSFRGPGNPFIRPYYYARG